MRDKWIFRYGPDAVREAALEKVEYHQKRRDYWQEERGRAEAELKEKGFEYRDRSYTAGHDVEIVGDPELAKRVSTAKRKADEHQKRVDEFERWGRALVFQIDDLELSFEDVEYFGL